VNEVVVLTEAAADAAGELLAVRHARERELFPLPPPAFEDPAQAARLVRDALAFCDGVAALDDRGTLVGFLTSFESMPDPRSPMARFAPERASLHLVHGHAVAGDADHVPLYAALFAELAGCALDRGITDYIVHVPIGDPATEAAWVRPGQRRRGT
jgi:hypothetical protein